MKWSTIWLIWLICVFGSFGILEGLALSINSVDTLSVTTWNWFNIQPGEPLGQWTLPHVLAVIVLLAISLVLVLHLGFGLFR